MPVKHRAAALLLACASACPLHAATVNLQAAADNTLYQDATGAASNGGGQHFFAGNTAFHGLRRACIRFDVSSIPAGSTINSVNLILFLDRAISGETPVNVHRLLAAWGEGASIAGGNEGGGDISQPGDATWIHTFYDMQLWTNQGGDFEPAVSATQMVSFVPTPITWSGPGLLADVQAWYDGSVPNHGWIIIGDEAADSTAKRFSSRENIDPMARPVLSIDFTPPPCAGDYDGDLDADFADITAVLASFNNPYTFADVTIVLANFGNDCN